MRTILLVALLSVSYPAHAEMVRLAVPCQEAKRICAFVWPKLKEIQGWAQDKQHSYRSGANMQAPDGFTFANAETVVYAAAVPKLKRPKVSSLQEFVEEDKSKFLARDPSLSISQLDSLKDKAGRSYAVYSFAPKSKGNWEQVAYSEETGENGEEYYLVFVLSSRTERGYRDSINDFNQFVATYE